MKKISLSTITAVTLLLAGGVSAAGMSGTITNPAGLKIPDVEVMLIEPGVDTQTVVSSDEGYYEFASTVMPGSYNIVIAHGADTIQDTVTFENDWDFLERSFVLEHAVVGTGKPYAETFSNDLLRLSLFPASHINISSQTPHGYTLFVTTPMGEMIASFSGQGPFTHSVSMEGQGGAVYLATLKTEKGTVTGIISF